MTAMWITLGWGDRTAHLLELGGGDRVRCGRQLAGDGTEASRLPRCQRCEPVDQRMIAVRLDLAEQEADCR